MTNEEAIKILSEYPDMIILSSDRQFDYKEACGMAIDALKEMSVEEYRQRLIDVFHRTDHDELLTYVVMPKEEEFKSLEYILSQYKFEPRPHGEWTVRHDTMYHFECPFCKYLHQYKDNFCPLCGADLREEGDNN